MFLDTETTGLSQDDQPISIGAVLAEIDLTNGVVLKEIASYYGLSEPSCKISEGAYRVHGISDSQLKNKEFDLKELVTMFGVAELIVAHNAAFDKRKLSFMGNTQQNWGCSCWDIDWPKEIGGRSLDVICKHFGINRPAIHNALSDTWAMINALQQTKDDGSTYLVHLLHKHRHRILAPT
ncbi:MAG: exonuclease domain-containing protein [Methylophilaceae bacterium]